MGWRSGGVSGASAAPHTAQVESNRTDTAAISEAALEQILELDRLNGGGVFARFAHTFLEAVPITLESVRTAVRQSDAAGIATAAHALKGASLNVGAEAMASVSQELEALGKSGTSEGAAALAAKLDELYVAVKDALESRLDQTRRQDPVPVQSAP